MKFTDAIRAGAMLHPQAFGVTFRHRRCSPQPVFESCAIGAALEAVGAIIIKSDTVFAFAYRAMNTPVDNPLERWPYLLTKSHYVCPECSCLHNFATLSFLVVHLNDNHMWTRNQIADWLDENEPEPEVAENVPADLAEAAEAAPVLVAV